MSTVLHPKELEQFRSVVARRLGLFFEENKGEFLNDVLRRRLEASNQSSGEYMAHLENKLAHDELAALAQELTVPETYFFRTNDQFRAFTEVCLPDRMAVRNSQRKLRLLSAACASGEEPYSLAILVREQVDPKWEVTIQAVDVNPAVLKKAARARYSSWALRETSPDIQRRWFRQEGRDAVLDESARSLVRFQERNLMDADGNLWQTEIFDIIFCRNVLLYFTPDNAQKVIARITRSLLPGGYLFLGHSETLRGRSSDFDLCHSHDTFYYRRKNQLDFILPSAGSTENLRAQPATPSEMDTIDPEATWISTVQGASERFQKKTRKLHSSASGSGSTRLIPATAKPRMELGFVLELLQKEQFSKALKLIQTLPPESAGSPDALLFLAVILTHSGRLTEAEATCHRLLAVDGLNPGVHYVLALCREGAGNRQGAIKQDQTAAYLDPGFAMPRLHMGLLARKGNDLETARRELSQAIVLLKREDPLRLLLFGGGFSREALIALCHSELNACGGKL